MACSDCLRNDVDGDCIHEGLAWARARKQKDAKRVARAVETYTMEAVTMKELSMAEVVSVVEAALTMPPGDMAWKTEPVPGTPEGAQATGYVGEMGGLKVAVAAWSMGGYSGFEGALFSDALGIPVRLGPAEAELFVRKARAALAAPVGSVE